MIWPLLFSSVQKQKLPVLAQSNSEHDHGRIVVRQSFCERGSRPIPRRAALQVESELGRCGRQHGRRRAVGRVGGSGHGAGAIRRIRDGRLGKVQVQSDRGVLDWLAMQAAVGRGVRAVLRRHVRRWLAACRSIRVQVEQCRARLQLLSSKRFWAFFFCFFSIGAK